MSLFGLKKEDKKETGQAKPTETGQVHVADSMSSVLVSPLVTEKALTGESERKYVFKVTPKASKPQVKRDIERLYNVKVETVNVINNKRKSRFVRGRIGYQTGMKKAIVKLCEGYKIEVAPR